jgi:hypothetical protein
MLHPLTRCTGRNPIPPRGESLSPDAFQVVEADPAKTQATLVDYRVDDLGDYDEVGNVLFVRPKGSPNSEKDSHVDNFRSTRA